MKVLVMGTHWDHLELPEGVKHFPHRHNWRINKERTDMDPHGRPYCTECGGKPSFYDLEWVDDESFKYIDGIKRWRFIKVEIDE